MKNKKIGLALGGGAVLQASHIEVLEEHNIKTSPIGGASIKSVISKLYTFEKTLSEINDNLLLDRRLIKVLFLNTFDFIFNVSTNLQLQDVGLLIRHDLSKFNAINPGYEYAYK